jgi:hypothetical protein
MATLPEAYEQYLAGLSADEADGLRPAFLQSVADGQHGVIVRGHGHYIQAFVDDKVPFGEIREFDRH